jgi:hypothetical protein
VDQGIQPAEAGDGEFDDTRTGGGILQILIARRRRAPGRRDLRNDAVRDRRVEAAAVLRHACVVDDDRGAASRKEARVGRAEASSCPGYNDDLAVKANGRQGYAGSSVRAAATACGSVSIA